jgi:hypothetical protein
MPHHIYMGFMLRGWHAFWQRAARSRVDPRVLAETDWSDLDAIWRAIVHAFDGIPWGR